MSFGTMSRERCQAVIVDDDPMLLDGLRTALRAEPYDLHTATDAEQALPMIARIKPDVVVSDYHLPGSPGTQLLANVRAMLPDCVRILMTGSPSLTMTMEAINEGAVSRLFLKPFQTVHLAFAMRDALERAELARLSLKLLEQSRTHAVIVDRVRRHAPHLLEDGGDPATRPTSGAIAADEYLPHDHAAILRALRREVR
jgi:DNA-binding NtrC family response regulator